MEGYQRPHIDPVVIRGEAGVEVPYGRRWEGLAPDDAYEVLTHPERFAPLHPICDALVEYLGRHYDVTVDHEPPLDSLYVNPGNDVVRAARLTPSGAEAASLTFVYTGFPGIHLYAGAVAQWPFPSCGCDACDEVWEEAADELEDTVRAVVSGNFAECLRRKGTSWWMETCTSSSDGESWASSHVSRKECAELRRRMAGVPEKWRPWPRR